MTCTGTRRRRQQGPLRARAAGSGIGGATADMGWSAPNSMRWGPPQGPPLWASRAGRGRSPRVG